MFLCTFLQQRKVTFDSALAHRQYFRQLFTCYCRRLFYEIELFLLTLIEFRLRHVSVMVSDILCVDSGKNDGLELVGVDLKTGFSSSLYPSKALVSLQMRESPLPRFSI